MSKPESNEEINQLIDNAKSMIQQSIDRIDATIAKMNETSAKCIAAIDKAQAELASRRNNLPRE